MGVGGQLFVAGSGGISCHTLNAWLLYMHAAVGGLIHDLLCREL